MALTFGFYDSLNGDRTYNAVQLSSIFDGVIKDGVFATVGNNLLVRAGTGMNVIVGSGRAWFNHTWSNNDADVILPVTQADVVLNRIDLAIIEINSAVESRSNSIKVLAGTPATNPVAPTLTNNATLHQYPLAEILVAAGVTGFTGAEITNKVGTNACPFALGALDTIDINDLLAQWDVEFSAWFDNLQNQLTENQATNLQNQIDVLTAQDNGWRALVDAWSFVDVDGPSGRIQANNATLFNKIQKGMRLSYKQVQALTAYWNLDANSNSQVGSFNGTDTNVTYTAGKFGNAATYNGVSSKTVIADAAGLKPTGEFTLGLWFKTSVAGGQTFFHSWSANPNIAGFHIEINPATYVLQIVIGKNTGTVQGVDYWVFATPGAMNDGQWHNAVFTHRNNYGQLYVDGVLVSAGFMMPPAYAATNYVRIGCSNNSGTDINFVNGQIDDVYLINGYALDEKTIVDKYLAGTAQGSGTLTLTKHGLVTAKAYSGGVSTLTFFSGTDFSLMNSAITEPMYSPVKVPFGFNISPLKWRYQLEWIALFNKASPQATTWYYTEFGSKNIVVHIGLWEIGAIANTYITSTNFCSVLLHMALSKLNNAPSDPMLHSRYVAMASSSPSVYAGIDLVLSKIIDVRVKTTYYLIHMIELILNISTLSVDGTSGRPTTLYLQSLYL